jgi:hypothetical protein
MRSKDLPPLLLATRRQRPLQLVQNHALIRPSRKNRLDDVGRQQRQPQDPAHVALRDFLGVADLADRGADAGIQQFSAIATCGRLP